MFDARWSVVKKGICLSLKPTMWKKSKNINVRHPLKWAAGDTADIRRSLKAVIVGGGVRSALGILWSSAVGKQTNAAAVPLGAHWLCLVSAHVTCIKLNLQEMVKAFRTDSALPARCTCCKYLKKYFYPSSAFCFPSRCTLLCVSVAVDLPDWLSIS